MKFFTVTLILSSVFLSSQAMAAGCLKGAVVGGAAGHVVGRHAVAGAIGGCLVGRHMATKKAEDEKKAENEKKPQQDAKDKTPAKQ